MRTPALLLLLGAATLSVAAPREPAITLTIETGAKGPVIDRHLFGQFAEYLSRGIYDGI